MLSYNAGAFLLKKYVNQNELLPAMPSAFFYHSYPIEGILYNPANFQFLEILYFQLTDQLRLSHKQKKSQFCSARSNQTFFPHFLNLKRGR